MTDSAPSPDTRERCPDSQDLAGEPGYPAPTSSPSDDNPAPLTTMPRANEIAPTPFATMMLERDEALAKLAASEARCEQLTGELAELDTALNRTHSVIIEPLERTLSDLRSKYDALVATVAMDGEVADPRDAITDMLCEFICEAAPMAWVERRDINSAHDWEKNAHAVLNRAAYGAPRTPAALDRPSQPEPAGGREIVVGSTWLLSDRGFKRERRGEWVVYGIDNRVPQPFSLGRVRNDPPGSWSMSEGFLRANLTWVSDPPAVTESATGEGPKT